MAVSKKLNPEAYDRLRGRVKKLMAGRKWTPQTLAGVRQVCGSIRDSSVYQREAALWASSGARAVADDKLKKALALSEQLGATSLSGKGVCYLQMGDRERAETFFRDALAADASDRDALIGLLGLALERGNAREAETRLKAALAAGMAEGDLLGQTIELALLKNDAVRARKLLTDAAREHPKEACYWGRLAEVMVNQGDALMVQQSLLPQMEKALESQDRYLVDAIRGVVLCKTDRKRLPEGRQSILKSLSANAAQPKLWNALLNIDMAINRPDFIEADARNRLGLEPDHALANYLLGAQLLRRGEWKGAEDFLRRSVEKKPLAMACNDLAETLRLLKKTREAEGFARKAIALDPAMPFAHDTLADILYDRGDYAGSAREEAFAAATGPNQPDYQLGWLRALVKMGDTAAVRKKVEDLKRAKIAIPEELKKESQKLVL